MKIAITRTDGGVSIMTLLVPEEMYLRRAAVMEQWKKELPGIYADHREIADSDVPTDRTFRDAWMDSGSSIVVNMDRAREIHKATLRTIRGPLLAELDWKYQLADETGDTERKVAIASQKQALRDVTIYPAIDAAKTPEELKQAIPPSLLKSI